MRTHQDLPKQFIPVGDKPVVVYVLETYQKHPEIDGIFVACLEGWESVLTAYAKQFNITKLQKVVTGGKTGQESIYNCVKAIRETNPDSDAVVLIQDGNRPMVSEKIISDCLATQRKYGSATTAIPTSDVVFVSEDGETAEHSFDRTKLWRTQTPQAFDFNILWDVEQKANADGVTGMTATCTLMEKYGYKTYFSQGSEKNIKITTAEDFEIFKALLQAKKDSWMKD